MAATSYDVYALSGYSASGSTLTGTPSTSLYVGSPGDTYSGVGLSDLSGNTAYLGDVADDTFIVKYGATDQLTLTYVGLMAYAAGSGTVTGFVGEASNGSYYLITVKSTATSPTVPAGTAGTGPLDNVSDTSTYWTIRAGQPGCFVAGTLIATPAGLVPVEDLAPGDLVLTEDGRTMPVRWAGRTTVSRVFADPLRIMPVRIKAGALGENLPARDLLVSPGHAIRIGDALIHAAALVNGTSVVREEEMPMVFTYYHVELDTHALLLAEGAPAESFLEGVEDFGFDNADERERPAVAAEMAYPRVKSPRQIPAAARALLAARAEVVCGAVAEAA